MDKRPAFSIVVITYNPDWDKLRRTLNSILAQRFTDYEIVVTDDGSKDNKFNMIEAYFKQRQFTNYKLLPHDENHGTVKNLIAGTEAASGEYIRDFGPGDMFYARDTLGKVYKFMKDNDYHIVAGLPIGYSITGDKRKAVPFSHPFDIEAYHKNDEKRILKNLILYSDMVCGANLSYEREFFLRYLHKIEDRVVYAEDLIQIVSAVEGDRVHFMPDRMIWYEVNTGNSAANSSFKEALKKDVESVFDMLLEEHPNNKLLQKRASLNKYYKIDNIVLRTLARSFTDPGQYVYLSRHYYQMLSGKHNPKDEK